MAFSPVGQMEMTMGLVARTVGVVFLAGVALFFVQLCQRRMWFRQQMTKYNAPTLPHSFLFGHLIAIGKVLAEYPGDFTKLGTIYALVRAHPELCAEGILYIDPWPFGKPMAAAFAPGLVSQFTQETSLPKSPWIRRELEPLTKALDIVSMEGSEWKLWRGVFNPGFSSKNLTALLPSFLEEIQVFKEKLLAIAKSGKVVQLEAVAQQATVDVICRAALGIRLHSQTKGSDFIKTLQNQIWWLVCDDSLMSRLKALVPTRPFLIWNNDRKMNNFLTPIIEDAAVQLDRGLSSGPKTINQLAIKAYRTEVQQEEPAVGAAAGKTPRLDARFMDIAIAQLKIFIFAGHDTTASTLAFAYSLLYKDDAVLAKVRAEHDQLLGSDPSQALARLTENPNLLNQMPYTAAVVKETLRLYPPGATVREGDLMLTHPDTGKVYPLTGFMSFSTSWVTHRLAKYFPRPLEFLPERWLAREGEPLHPPKNVYRPFELGPRNCIGQELALLEIRAILAMTVRDLDFEPAYSADAPEVWGEKAYQSMGFGDITGHVKSGFPVRVHERRAAVVKQ